METIMVQENWHGSRPNAVPRAAYFALSVVMLANLFNYLDRQILSILAQSIKADLRLDDAELGFLLGTAFAVFYSVVGIAMGRISDGLPRKKLMAFGLTLWSLMTALGGLATSLTVLGFARIGVGVGESVAHPCSHSLVADLFPARNRAVAMSILMSGVFLGGALAMVIGGALLERWPDMCRAVPLVSACGIAPWRAALLIVGLPGPLLALAVLAIREPFRPGLSSVSGGRLVLREIAGAVPPFTMVTLFRLGGARALLSNVALVAAVSLVAAGLIRWTGDFAQWAAFALGAYAVVTWGQIQSHRDRPLFRLTFGCPTFVLCNASTALLSCLGGAVTVWSAPFAIRTFAIAPRELGLSLAGTSITGALIGLLAGGWLTDLWRAHDLRAPLGMAAIALVGSAPCVLLMLLGHDFTLFLIANFALGFFSAIWTAGNSALVQDLVLPRMRGAAAASYSLVAIIISSGTGPYWAGKVSAVTGSLTTGLLSMMGLLPIALCLMWLAARRLRYETPQARRDRAAAAGEA